MVCVNVRLSSRISRTSAGRVYALLLPDANGTWAELEVAMSGRCGGFGVFPKQHAGSLVDWNDVGNVPVILLYFWCETVVNTKFERNL
jgi:hypothetical protein